MSARGAIMPKHCPSRVGTRAISLGEPVLVPESKSCYLIKNLEAAYEQQKAHGSPAPYGGPELPPREAAKCKPDNCANQRYDRNGNLHQGTGHSLLSLQLPFPNPAGGRHGQRGGSAASISRGLPNRSQCLSSLNELRRSCARNLEMREGLTGLMRRGLRANLVSQSLAEFSIKDLDSSDEGLQGQDKPI